MFIREIRLENLLPFGPESPALLLRPLNVLIGPNGSGKSNLIEALSLLQAAPLELATPIGTDGGLREWLWKGATSPIATIEAPVENPRGKIPLRHRILFREAGLRFELSEEAIEDAKAYPGPAPLACLAGVTGAPYRRKGTASRAGPSIQSS